MRDILLIEGKVGHRLLTLEVTFKVHRRSDLSVFVLPQDVAEHCIATETEKVIEIQIHETWQVWIQGKSENCLVIFADPSNRFQTDIYH
jgi:hypothetical protein